MYKARTSRQVSRFTMQETYMTAICLYVWSQFVCLVNWNGKSIPNVKLDTHFQLEILIRNCTDVYP